MPIYINMDKTNKSNDIEERLISIVLMPPDLAYAVLIKLLMERIADTLSQTASPTPAAYSIKEMSETLLNIGESLKISSSLNTEETKEFIQQLSKAIDKTQLSDKLIKSAREQAGQHLKLTAH